MALGVYSNVFGHLPASYTADGNGEPATSWRFLLVNYYDQLNWSIHPEPDHAWNSSANAAWAAAPFKLFCFSPNSCTTNVVAVTGQGTAFDRGRTYAMEELPDDTILIIEMNDSNLHWMQPGDLEIRCLSCLGGSVRADEVFGTAADSFTVGFADNQAWALSKNVPLTDVRKFFTIEGARRFDRNVVLGPYRLLSQ